MTIQELLQGITSTDGVWTLSKQINNEQMLIFWKGQSPIASVSGKSADYRTDYPELFEMELEYILQINDCL